MTKTASNPSQPVMEALKNVAPPELPLRAIMWYLLIEPWKPPEKTQGGIVIAEASKEAEEIMTTVGKVLQMGSLCFTGQTKSGLSLANETDKPTVGDFVLYQRYTGQVIKLRDGRRIIELQDSEVLAKVTDPSALRYHI